MKPTNHARLKEALHKTQCNNKLQIRHCCAVRMPNGLTDKTAAVSTLQIITASSNHAVAPTSKAQQASQKNKKLRFSFQAQTFKRFVPRFEWVQVEALLETLGTDVVGYVSNRNISKTSCCRSGRRNTALWLECFAGSSSTSSSASHFKESSQLRTG